MKCKVALISLGVLALLGPAWELSAEEPGDPEEAIPQDDVDPADWGIWSNCIRTNRIKSIKFIDDQNAMISIPHKKTILMRLKRRCPGIKNEGFVYKVRSAALCARADYLTVMRSGIVCQIESFEPYLTLDDPSEDLDEDLDEEEGEAQ